MVLVNRMSALLVLMAISHTFEIAYSYETGKPPSHDPVGAPVVKDPNDPKYSLLADDSLRQYEAENQLKVRHVVLKVYRVTETIVAGLKTEIDFYAAPTVCQPALYGHGLSNCLPNKNDLLNCHSLIHDRLGKHDLHIEVNCKRVKPMNKY